MKTDRLNICLIPMELKWGDKESNLCNVSSLLEQVHSDTDLVVLPEAFSTGFPSGNNVAEALSLAESISGNTVSVLKDSAYRHNFAIAGSFIASEDDSLFNRAFFIEPTGDVYFADKRHLFSIGGEDKAFTPGNKRMSVRYRGWNISMIVCYDVRFPVWCRNSNNSYDLLLAVANWPASRASAWELLTSARAVENEAYVAAVNCKGLDSNGTSYNGESFIYDFKGKSIGKSIDGLIYASLSKDNLETFRKKFPAWKDADEFEIK